MHRALLFRVCLRRCVEVPLSGASKKKTEKGQGVKDFVLMNKVLCIENIDNTLAKISMYRSDSDMKRKCCA